MVLKDFSPDSEEDKRQLYFGMTRARKTLTIHYNGDYFYKGYKPFTAKVNHLLFWKQEDLEDETLILLPQIEFIRDDVADNFRRI